MPGTASSADKKSDAKISANPAMQQQPKCSTCGNEPDESKCPKEIGRLKKSAQSDVNDCHEADKSTKCDSRSEEVTVDDANE